MNQEKTVAIVLKRTNYGEADRIVQFITPLGRRSVIARGVRKERSKLAGGIELLSESDVVTRRGKGKLDLLMSSRMRRFFQHVLTDYDRMMFAYEMLRLVAKGSDQVDEPEWYDVALQTLEGLDDIKIPLSLVQAWFYINFAALSGYEISLWRDVEGNKIDESLRYVYDVSERGLRVAKQGDTTAEHVKILRLLSKKSLRIVSSVGGVQPYLATVAAIARQHASVD